MNINVSDGKILEASGPLKGILKNYELGVQNLMSTGGTVVLSTTATS